jgi:hypothetical protein
MEGDRFLLVGATGVFSAEEATDSTAAFLADSIK